LKELDLTEGRSTGIPKIRLAMERNGSPGPIFDTDDERTYFLVRLPIHPAFLQSEAKAHDEVYDEVYDDWTETEKRVLSALRSGPLTAQELLALFGLERMVGHLQKALNRLQERGLIEFTIPDKPRSKNQKRRLTARGEQIAATLTEQSRNQPRK
jgi:ATP-dependent DNA helicase RecG